MQQGLRALKKSAAAKKLVLIADVCLCEYTSHGHCGMVIETRDGFEVDNDSTLDLLARTAVSLAQAGADVVAPSDMMDGRVARHPQSPRRRRLMRDTPILSYASKFASAFYGPFREAADSAPQFGDRKTYQMDGANLREAHARDRSRSRRGRGHDPDEARHALSGRGARGARARGCAHWRLPGFGRVLHAAGRV